MMCECFSTSLEYLCGEGRQHNFFPHQVVQTSAKEGGNKYKQTERHTHLSFMKKCQACERRKTSCDIQKRKKYPFENGK